MPTYQFQFIIEGVTSQRATVIRDRLVAKLLEEGYATVVAMSRTTAMYRVIGVDVATREVIDDRFEATDRTAAENAALAAYPDLVVVTVREGEV
jgi:hypothetical protein